MINARSDEGAPLHSDIVRAETKVPRKQYRGNDFPHMSAKLNLVLQKDPRISTRKCSSWTVHELQELQTKLFQLRHGAFESIYQQRGDKRRLSAGLEGLAGLQREWSELKAT